MSKPIKQRNVWRIRWNDELGHRQSEVHNKYEDAKFALNRHETKVEEIRRGLKGLSVPKKTFFDLCDYWLTYRAPLKRNQKDDESIIRAHLKPFFNEKLLGSIKKSDIDLFKISKQHLSPKTISNQLTLLISMFNAAVEEGWLKTYPKIKKPKISIFSKDFHYLKTDEEIFRFIYAAKEEGEQVYTMYTLAIFTGMREGEIAGLKKSDIDFSHKQITVQRSFGGPTKNGLIRRVPILDVLFPILESWCRKTPGEFVFQNRNGEMFGESARIFQEVLHRTLDRGQFPKIEKYKKIRRYIVFHDLRHTFASHWMMKGGNIYKLRDILGHQNIAMTERYAHLSPHTFTADLNRFDGLSMNDISNVVSISAHHNFIL